ncbi:unnamed protein product [Caenorhabditis auriculariae]|uniref:Uncharacterized protein n=1 Tax=Caenorhabditis auriculariae TaxID=2777116 RepID=A0A8S1H124_9PELO|nr:unnamed protein product [Caenorhabditis auriculariae]
MEPASPVQMRLALENLCLARPLSSEEFSRPCNCSTSSPRTYLAAIVFQACVASEISNFFAGALHPRRPRVCLPADHQFIQRSGASIGGEMFREEMLELAAR